jgi:cell division protein FtsI (penicillin-binding protein 3)
VQRSDKEFVYLKRHLNPDDARAILKLDIPGIASEREFRRYYPNSEVMAHVLGFTNIDDRGQEGLELAFDDWLAGKPGVKRVIRDLHGQVVENVELLREAQPGRDLTLSIDRRIQYLAYRELLAGLQEHHATSGSMVIIDVPTGEVLAMVNAPSFNPNARNGVDPSFRRNRAVTDVVEPGSTIKAFTISAALESGKWKPHTPVDTTPGTFTLADGRVIRDVHNKGLLDGAPALRRRQQARRFAGKSRARDFAEPEAVIDVVHVIARQREADLRGADVRRMRDDAGDVEQALVVHVADHAAVG